MAAIQPIKVDFWKTKNLNGVQGETSERGKNHQFVFRDTHGRLVTRPLMWRLPLSGVGVATSPSWPPPGPALPPATQELEKMAARSKVSERGEKAEATPTAVSGATVERAAARLVLQDRLMIAFFFFF